eukprot:scaffold21626_cov132-Cylindrotheca_fusiformis.AAC.1
MRVVGGDGGGVVFLDSQVGFVVAIVMIFEGILLLGFLTDNGVSCCCLVVFLMGRQNESSWLLVDVLQN